MEKINGLLLAQNKEQYKGYTVFHLPFEGGTIKMMALKDVKKITSHKQSGIKQ